jgi:hypothetical protein
VERNSLFGSPTRQAICAFQQFTRCLDYFMTSLDEKGPEAEKFRLGVSGIFYACFLKVMEICGCICFSSKIELVFGQKISI